MSLSCYLRSRGLWLLLGAVALGCCAGLVGCGGKGKGGGGPAEVYVAATLQAVAARDSASGPGLFEIAAPQFDYVKGNTGVVRDGNARVFIVGKDLEQNYKSYEGKKLGVKKFVRPSAYLRIQRVGKSVVDTNYALVVPRTIRLTQRQVQTSGAPLPELDWTKIDEAQAYLPKKAGDPPIEVQTLVQRFIRAPKPGNPQETAWYAVFPKASFELDGLSPGAGWVLDLLNAKLQSLQGSFSVTSLESDYAARETPNGKAGHVIGKLKVNWFRYGTLAIKGTDD